MPDKQPNVVFHDWLPLSFEIIGLAVAFAIVCFTIKYTW